mmetsp:Transcript_2207/g.2046  ORF Transcript_2207/g.2046 Transcript_2207/m.2046 type:complete len:237 (-) Transcript_2207:103-813(-)
MSISSCSCSMVSIIMNTLIIALFLSIIMVCDALTADIQKQKGFTGVRISLYPKVKGDQSLKEAIKTAVKGISDLGLEVRPDDCSTVFLGPEPALFEAVRVIFGRACRFEGEPHVSMICTFSGGCPGEPDESPLPNRLAETNDWIVDAFQLPSRVACQYAVYPLGSADYMETIKDVINSAKESPSYKGDIKTHFCTMLDGDGSEVFDVLRSSFALARTRNAHVTMTATLTANKALWK